MAEDYGARSLAVLGNYGICSASDSKAGDSTNNNMERTETETLTDESLVYDLVPLSGEADNVTRLQVDNLKEALGFQGNENEGELSLCIWFELRLGTTAATLFSYSTSDAMANAILLYVTSYELGYVSDITRKDFAIIYRFEPLRWYHVCLVVRKLREETEEKTSESDGMKYAFAVYVDGLQLIDDQSAVPFPLGGILIIGQDQDGLGTGFSKDQSLVGRVSLSAFKEAIGKRGAEELFQCRVVKNQVPITWNVYGLVSKSSFNICKYNVDRGIVIPFKMDDKAKAKIVCELINTTLALPKSDEENDALAEQLSREPACNSLPFFNFNIGWLGFFHEENSGGMSQQESLKAYNKLSTNISNVQMYDLLLTSDGTWKLGWPNIACPLCFGKPSGKFYLFGLHKTITDKKMMVFYPRVTDAGSFFLYSSDGTVIEKKDDKWTIIDKIRNQTLASTEEPNFLGRKPWNVMNTTIINGMKQFFPYISSPSSQLKILTLSNCSLDEFTCNNGECRPMSCRCDFRQQCKSGEDEDSCNILDPLQGYEKGTPPPQRPLNLQISVFLTKVASINIMTETMQVNMKFRIKWDDSRLTFNNLMGNDRVNYLGQYMNTLWLPKFMVLNEEPLAGTADPITKLYVERTGTPIRVNQG
ncbi:uncharacterized protein [Palaemon carinicauda]|uniref:uncharacterized protein n=1 Tax=Palaemon carinicauda TaxID=392227 RepID=UPI0035B5CE55